MEVTRADRVEGAQRNPAGEHERQRVLHVWRGAAAADDREVAPELAEREVVEATKVRELVLGVAVGLQPLLPGDVHDDTRARTAQACEPVHELARVEKML